MHMGESCKEGAGNLFFLTQLYVPIFRPKTKKYLYIFVSLKSIKFWITSMPNKKFTYNWQSSHKSSCQNNETPCTYTIHAMVGYFAKNNQKFKRAKYRLKCMYCTVHILRIAIIGDKVHIIVTKILILISLLGYLIKNLLSAH